MSSGELDVCNVWRFLVGSMSGVFWWVRCLVSSMSGDFWGVRCLAISGELDVVSSGEFDVWPFLEGSLLGYLRDS